MTLNLLLSLLLLVSAVASIPLDDSASSKDDSVSKKESTTYSSTGDHADEDDSGISFSDNGGIEDEDAGEDQQPEFCSEPYTFTIVHKTYAIIEGIMSVYNETVVVNTTKCCEGYAVDMKCRLDLCMNRTCQEDPESKCVTLKWCGNFIPVFVSNTGMISDACMQPMEEQLNKCSNDTSICKKSAHCPGGEEAVCVSNKCDCTPGPVWLLHNGKEALCQT